MTPSIENYFTNGYKKTFPNVSNDRVLYLGKLASRFFGLWFLVNFFELFQVLINDELTMFWWFWNTLISSWFSVALIGVIAFVISSIVEKITPKYRDTSYLLVSLICLIASIANQL